MMMRTFTLFLFLLVTFQIYPQNVTFKVDMTNQTGFSIVNVNGNFNNWCGTCNALTDSDGDGIWETTLQLNDGDYEYKFTVDGWTGQEELNQGMVETTSNDCEFGVCTNRFLSVSGTDITLDVVPYGGTNVSAGPYDVTFNVDMTGYTGTINSVNLNGENHNNQGLGNWCGSCIAMTDDDGDNIYSVTLSLEAYNYAFKFTVNGWGDQEMFTSGTSKTQTVGGNTNRFLNVDKNTTLSAVWNQNNITLGIPVIDNKNEIITFPNPTKDIWVVKTNSNTIQHLKIIDLLGKHVFELASNQNTISIDASKLNKGIYIAQIITESGKKISNS